MASQGLLRDSKRKRLENKTPRATSAQWCCGRGPASRLFLAAPTGLGPTAATSPPFWHGIFSRIMRANMGKVRKDVRRSIPFQKSKQPTTKRVRDSLIFVAPPGRRTLIRWPGDPSRSARGGWAAFRFRRERLERRAVPLRRLLGPRPLVLHCPIHSPRSKAPACS
jgi:hypothetical protein